MVAVSQIWTFRRARALVGAGLLLASSASLAFGSPLFKAIAEDDLAVINVLLRQGADVNERENGEGPTPLFRTASSFLSISLGFPDDVFDESTSHVRIAILALLLEKGADPNFATADGMTPLHYVAMTKFGGAAKLLIEHGADIDAPRRDGMPPLHMALMSAELGMAKFLLDKGADVQAAGQEKVTVLHAIVREGDRRIEELKLLLSYGADANAKTKDGFTPLHTLAGSMFGSHFQARVTIPLLIEAGSDVNARTDQGATPLHYAAQFGYREIAQILLENGARVDLRTKDDYTPLALARKAGTRESKAVAVLLEQHGATE